MIENSSLRVTSSNQYLMSSSGSGAACLTAPTYGELLLDSGLNSLAWLEQPMSLSDMAHQGNTSFIF